MRLEKARVRAALASLVVASFILVGAATSASAATATATLSAGALAFVSAPGNVTFSATLNGVDQTVTSNQGLDVGDGTGSGAASHVTVRLTDELKVPETNNTCSTWSPLRPVTV